MSVEPFPTAADPGWFGPDSVIWRVHGHPSALVGGLRALLVQTLHPLAMAGIAQHSTYRDDPLGRFRRTAQFVNDTTYGSTAQAEAAVALVRRIHPHIKGVAPDGRPYRAADPPLLSWVHNVEADSILTASRRFGPRLTDADADRYVVEMARVGAAVGADDLPETARDLHRWVDTHPEKRVTPDARRAARWLVFPRLPAVLLPPYSLLAASAVSLLGVRDRIALRLPSIPPVEPLLVPAARVYLNALGIVMGPPPALTAAHVRCASLTGRSVEPG
jgi:uncharacterized protein (DUF2236 family)